MSLRWKVALALATVGLMSAVAVTLFTYRSTNQRLIDEVDSSIEQAGQVLTIGAGDRRIPQQRGLLEVYSIRIIRPDGAVATSTYRSIERRCNESEIGADERLRTR